MSIHKGTEGNRTVVIVGGGTSGIGRATVARILGQGLSATVYIDEFSDFDPTGFDYLNQGLKEKIELSGAHIKEQYEKANNPKNLQNWQGQGKRKRPRNKY